MAVEKTRRLVFLCSGGGGNLAFIHQMIERGRLPGISIVGVVTDRHCQANDFSTRNGLRNAYVDFKFEGQGNLLAILDELAPDLIITTVHKILLPAIVERYRGRLINLHYSLLPAFGGLIGSQPVQSSLDYGVLFSGVTVHLVDESVDGGRPLSQGVIALREKESIDDLMQVVFRCGCAALLSAITHTLMKAEEPSAPSSLNILGRLCLFNGGNSAPKKVMESEEFWHELRRSLDTRH
ncbi:hypothetical protein NTD84_20820 [Pseudomonas sp. 14P_8.1_Bac3]|uniref:formyltransferase family protein n=1 Tax=Pseudomonas sp. 14P_8.1_Bac3 TaxID=2971621 RepID=UPI0021C96E4C|nr:formyltransferase family protein [Pseudomonas sp. 14P_8.1_Bac3]MCU1762151.1 hypothetical protein [Pseudomonas sp. 14P_8.1_Bac3]